MSEIPGLDFDGEFGAVEARFSDGDGLTAVVENREPYARGFIRRVGRPEVDNEPRTIAPDRVDLSARAEGPKDCESVEEVHVGDRR